MIIMPEGGRGKGWAQKDVAPLAGGRSNQQLLEHLQVPPVFRETFLITPHLLDVPRHEQLGYFPASPR